MLNLTPRQSQVLDLIKEFIKETGLPPTRVDIARILGFKSPNAAEDHLRALARKGAIHLIPGASRGIRLPEDEGMPVIGRVAAGSPLLAEEHVDKHMKLAPELFNPPADYLLKVRGMSMKNIGIMDGDLLAVHRTQQVRNGQIVVARIGDEVTVKRFERKGSRVRLIPENDELDPIEVDTNKEELVIEGIAVGVIRNDF